MPRMYARVYMPRVYGEGVYAKDVYAKGVWRGCICQGCMARVYDKGVLIYSCYDELNVSHLFSRTNLKILQLI